MATKVGGITIEIGGNATELTNALKKINQDLAQTGASLREVNKLLSFNPDSAKQFADKQELLSKQLMETRDKLILLKKAYEEMSQQDGFDENSKAAIALRTEISKTEGECQRLSNALRNTYNNDSAKNFKEHISEINTKLAESSDKLRNVNERLKLDPNNVSLLAEKAGLLKENMAETAYKLDLLKQRYTQLSQVSGFDENSKEATELKAEIEKCNSELEKSSFELQEVGKKRTELTKVADEVEKTTEKVKPLNERFKETGKSIEEVGKKLSIVSGAVARVGAFGAKEFISFEAEISKTAAAMGTTVDQIEDIEAEARRLGQTTVFTAKESASAFTILAQAGYVATKQIEVAPQVLDLAAAGGLDMASAAKYLTGTLNGFANKCSIAVDESGELTTTLEGTKDIVSKTGKVFSSTSEASQYFADLMAKGATLAKTNVAELGEAMSVTASVASGVYNQSAEDVTIALLRLADQNVTAAQAGTALNQVMARLYTPTKAAADALEELGVSAYDSSGKARNINEVVDELSGKLAGLSDEERATYEKAIFAQRGLKSFSQMAATSAEKTDELYEALAGYNGSASQQAATMLDNVQGKLTLMKSALSEAGITLGEKLKPAIVNTTNVVRDLSNWFSSLDSDTVSNIVSIGALVAAIGPAVVVVGKLTSAVGVLMAHPVIGGIAAATVAIGGLVLAVNNFYDSSNNAITATMAETDALESYVANMDEAKNKASERTSSASKVAKANNDEFNSYYNLLAELDTYIDKEGKVKEGNEERVEYIQGALSDAFGIELDLLGKQAGKYGEVRKEIERVIKTEEARFVLSAYQEAYTKALEEQETAMENLLDATEKAEEAHSKLSGTQTRITQNREEYEMLNQQAAILRTLWERSGSEWYADELAKVALKIQGLDEEYTELNIVLPEFQKQTELADKALSDASTTYGEVSSTIERYGALSRAVAEGDVKAMSDAMVVLKNNLLTTKTANKEALLQQALDFDEHYKKVLTAVKNGDLKMSAEHRAELEKMRLLAWGEYNKAADDATMAGANIATKYAAGFTSKKKDIIDSVYGIGKNLSEGLAKGINDYAYEVSNAASSVANNALKQIRNVGVIKSPSHVTQYYGEMIDRGLAKGMLDNSYLPENAAGEVMGSTLGNFNGGGILTAQRSGFGSSASTTNNTNVGGMTFVINSQPGQNVQELARQVSIEVQRAINSQKAVFA